MIFAFESDFAGSLRCIPMIARQKLDLAGIKLSLRQWSRFSREERGDLTERAADTPESRAGYRERVLALIDQRADEPPKFLPDEDFSPWQADDQMPAAVAAQAEADGIPAPTPAQWAALTPLERFALIKLAGSKHESANFVPALREFGLIT